MKNSNIALNKKQERRKRFLVKTTSPREGKPRDVTRQLGTKRNWWGSVGQCLVTEMMK
jgi:hypothetical protein